MIEVLKEVIDSMSPEIKQMLQDKIIRYTYEYDYFPNYKYEDLSDRSGIPSFEFLNAFRWKGSKKSLNQVSNEFFYMWSSMKTDPNTGKHYEGRDTRKDLADMLNTIGIVGHKQRGNYWDIFLDELDKEIDGMYLRALKQAGLNVK